MNYILTKDEKKAKDISKGLWKVRKPVSDPNDVTEFLYGYITHPTDGRTAMQFELADDIPIRSEEGLQIIAEAFIDPLPENPTVKEQEDWVKAIDNQQKELEKLGKELDKGKKIKLDKILPKEYVILSQAEMEADGWFDESPG